MAVDELNKSRSGIQLTEGDKAIGRRNFLKAAAALPAVGAFAYSSAQAGPLKVGVIGTGMEGRILISAMNPKYTYIVAMCDIRPDNQVFGKWTIGQAGHAVGDALRVYTDYRDICRDPEVEAVVIATPLHTHAPIAIEAMKNGKHVMTEKTMAYTVDECLEMIKVAEENNVNLQVGHMRFYNPLYWDAFRMMKDGLLGNVYHVRAMWHRNTDWNYFAHIEKKSYYDMINDKSQFDPTKYGYKDLMHMVNWRWYKETSHGLWTELCSHQIAITNWLFGNENGDVLPTAVMASGGKYKTWEDFENFNLYERNWPDEEEQEWRRNYDKSDEKNRSISDHVYAIFEYPENRTVTYSAIQSNSLDNCYEQIMGTYATIILANENEYYLFWEPGWDENKAKMAAEGVKATQTEVSQEDQTGSAFSAHVSAKATGGGGASDMSPTEPYKWELMGFADTIKRGAPNLC
ncbi:MAG: Gfo/Idh/MocA family protein, partial [Candidatus Hinthialibacter sp.]